MSCIHCSSNVHWVFHIKREWIASFCVTLRKIFELQLKRSSPIRRKTDWSESKKEIKLVALRDKKRKNAAQIVLAGTKLF